MPASSNDEMSAPTESRRFHLSVPSVLSAFFLINAGQALVLVLRDPLADVAIWFINYGARNKDLLTVHYILISWEAALFNLAVSAVSLALSYLLASWNFRQQTRRA